MYSTQPLVEKAYTLMSSLIQQRHALANKSSMLPALPSLSLSISSLSDEQSRLIKIEISSMLIIVQSWTIFISWTFLIDFYVSISVRPTEHYRQTVLACYDYCWPLHIGSHPSATCVIHMSSVIQPALFWGRLSSKCSYDDSVRKTPSGVTWLPKSQWFLFFLPRKDYQWNWWRHSMVVLRDPRLTYTNVTIVTNVD
jgi:hypothetical protein